LILLLLRPSDGSGRLYTPWHFQKPINEEFTTINQLLIHFASMDQSGLGSLIGVFYSIKRPIPLRMLINVIQLHI